MELLTVDEQLEHDHETARCADTDAPGLNALKFHRHMLRSQRSCDFTNVAGPCIQKVTRNLSELQDRLNEWQRELLSQDRDIRGKNESELHKSNAGCKRDDSPLPLSALAQTVANPSSKNRQAENKVETMDLTTKTPSQVSNILDGIFYLLGRLETDRVNTLKALETEKERIVQLRKQIDLRALERIEILPAAVQQEHEKCAYDLQELKWHVAFRGRARDRIANRVKQAESINKKITEEIAFVQNSSPLIKEKLECEKRSMIAVQTKQETADLELKIALGQMESAASAFEVALRQAEGEQKQLKETHEDAIYKLNHVTDSLQKQKLANSDFQKQLSRLQKKVGTTAEDLLQFEQMVANAKGLEAMRREEAESTTEKIVEQAAERKNLAAKNEEYKISKIEQEKSFERKISELENAIKLKTGDFRKLVYTNRASEKEIKDLKRKIYDCEKQQSSDAKAVKRAIAEREKIEGDLQMMCEEAEKLRTTHDKLLLALDQQRSKAADVEESLKEQSEALKKQLKDESHQRTVLQARIAVDTADLNKRKQDGESKRQKLLKTHKEVEDSFALVTAQVAKLGAMHSDRLKAIEILSKMSCQVSLRRQEVEQQLTSQLQSLVSDEEKVKKELSDICAKQEEMDSRKITMQRRMDDMASSRTMMEKVVTASQKTIDALKDEVGELRILADSRQGLKDTLQKTLDSFTERVRIDTEAHRSLVSERSVKLDSVKLELHGKLEENKLLATTYCSLQDKQLSTKSEFTNCLEKSLLASDSLKDTKSICELHGRLHEALKSYYRLRGLQTQAGICRFETLSTLNSRRLAAIERELEEAISNIAAFLASNKQHVRVSSTEESNAEPCPTMQLGSQYLCAEPGANKNFNQSAPSAKSKFLPKGEPICTTNASKRMAKGRTSVAVK